MKITERGGWKFYYHNGKIGVTINIAKVTNDPKLNYLGEISSPGINLSDIVDESKRFWHRITNLFKKEKK